MINFLWKGWEWFAYEHAKNNSEADRHSYYAENVVKTENDEMFFYIKYAPQSFENDTMNEDKTRQFGCAIMESSHEFTYGKFIFEARMPNSPLTFPAIWLYNPSLYPAEIDVLEAYPDRDGCVLGWKDVRWETNVHYGDRVKQYGAKGLSSIWYLLTHRKNKADRWVLDWTPNYIKFYFNGVCVRTIKDVAVLEFMNRVPKMRVVINTMTQEGFGQVEYTKQQGFYLTKFDYIPYRTATFVR